MMRHEEPMRPSGRPYTQSLATERYRYVILVLTLLAVITVQAPVYSIGALAPLLRATLHVSREQIGWLTACFYAGTALMCIPAGGIAERFGTRFPLIAAQVLGGMCLVVTPLLQTYSALLLCMFLEGLAYGTVAVVTAKVIYDWFPVTLRATAMGARLCALPVSGTLASLIMPVVAQGGNWQQSFAMLGGLMLASALCHIFLYRNRLPEAPRADALPNADRSGSVFRDRNIWLLAAVGFLFGGVKYTSTAYLGLFAYDSWQISLAHAASLLALAHLTSMPAYLLFGLVSDRWLRGERKGLLCGIVFATIVVIGVFLMIPPGTSPLVLALLIILYGFSGLSWGGMYQTLVVEVASQTSTGVGVGISVTLLYLGSTATAPVFGYVADTTGSYTASWGVLMLGCLLGIGLLSWVKTSPDHVGGAPYRTRVEAIEEPR
jgi:sugar phosphate permease